MVGPSTSDSERRGANRRLMVAFVLLVGVSGGLVALQAGASPGQMAVFVGIGLLVGALLLRYLVRVGREFRRT